MDVDRSIDGWELANLPALRYQFVVLHFVCVNELSVERLHRVGAGECRHAFNNTPAYVSTGLRSHCLADKHQGWQFDNLSRAFKQVRSIGQVVEVYELESHPTLVDARLAHLEKTGSFDHFHYPERLVRFVWYRSDLKTMFDSFPVIKAAIQAFNDVQPKPDDVRTLGPFAAASARIAPDDEKVTAMKTKYAFRHWKDPS